MFRPDLGILIKRVEYSAPIQEKHPSLSLVLFLRGTFEYVKTVFTSQISCPAHSVKTGLRIRPSRKSDPRPQKQAGSGSYLILNSYDLLFALSFRYKSRHNKYNNTLNLDVL